MTPTPNKAAGAVARTAAGEQAEAAAGVGPFVLNLCSSSTPMALEQAQHPELKRFSFFVSRRLEEGRERFRLHMGYFPTLAEAQEWLNAVRDIYPSAWAGEAPGKKLRERAAAAAATTAAVQAQARQAHTAAQPPTAAAHAQVLSTSAPGSRPTPIARPASQVPLNVPTLHAGVPTIHAAAPVAPRLAQPAAAQAGPRSSSIPVARAGQQAPAQNAAGAAPQARVMAPSRSVTTASNTRAAPRAPAPPARAAVATAKPPVAKVFVSKAPLSKAPASPKAGVSAPISTTAPATGAARPAGKPASNTRHGKSPGMLSSNVREVLAALDESTGETRMMPAPFAAQALMREDDPSLTDTQVLRFLEVRREDPNERVSEDANSGIALLKPDDTGTRRALKAAVAHNAPVSFAVQLQWSVQPVELEKVPSLAIFSAYTLYTVEGSRDGRRWYGLRLGFFTDAVSAKQVAYYVRSEFASVAVVPVSPQEREHASDDGTKSSSLSAPKRPRQQPVDEFKLIDVAEQPAVPARAAAAKPIAPKPVPATQASMRRGGGRVRARDQRSPQTLEETLEILGASQLEIDNGNGETLNDTGVRHLRVEIQKNTPFRRLIDRLSERVRKP